MNTATHPAAPPMACGTTCGRILNTAALHRPIPTASSTMPGIASSYSRALVISSAPASMMSSARIAVLYPPWYSRSAITPPPMRMPDASSEYTADRSCVPVTHSRYDRSREYGMGWWIQDVGGDRACFAWGYGGQYIMVFRELDLVVVVTSNPNISDERRGYRRAVFDLLQRACAASGWRKL
jgi:CubicO group peptidase (beta-lactamase class C family)